MTTLSTDFWTALTTRRENLSREFLAPAETLALAEFLTR